MPSWGMRFSEWRDASWQPAKQGISASEGAESAGRERPCNHRPTPLVPRGPESAGPGAGGDAPDPSVKRGGIMSRNRNSDNPA